MGAHALLLCVISDLEVNDFDRVIAKGGGEERLATGVNSEMVNPAVDIGKRDGRYLPWHRSRSAMNV
jgi:hypothetical protein